MAQQSREAKVFRNSVSLERQRSVSKFLAERSYAFQYWFPLTHDFSSQAILTPYEPGTFQLGTEMLRLQKGQLTFVEKADPNFPTPQLAIYTDTLGYRLIDVDREVQQTPETSTSRRRTKPEEIGTHPGIQPLPTPNHDLRRLYTIMQVITDYQQEASTGNLSFNVSFWDINKDQPLPALPEKEDTSIGVAVLFINPTQFVDLSTIVPGKEAKSLTMCGFVLEPELGSKSKPSNTSHGKLRPLVIPR